MWRQSLYLIGLLAACQPAVANTSAFIEGLYWQVGEGIDWALENNFALPNQTVSIHSLDYDFDPGFRLGLSRDNVFKQGLNAKLRWTHYQTRTSQNRDGNLISDFLGGKSLSPFYQSGQVNFQLDFNIVDLAFSQDFQLSPNVTVRPALGLIGGRINQEIVTQFDGIISVHEAVANDFSGFGGQAGLGIDWMISTPGQARLFLTYEANAAYLWARWTFNDVATASNGKRFITRVDRRNSGAVALQGFAGLRVNWAQTALRLGYEIADWIDQYQVFDDGTGTHNSDLILQGISLGIFYQFNP